MCDHALSHDLAVGENLILVSNFVPQGQYDLSLGFYATALSFFNPVDGQGRDPGFYGKFCFGQEEFSPNFSYEIMSHNALGSLTLR